MNVIFKEIKEKYFNKKYCSICNYCCNYDKYNYIFDDDGIIEYYDGYRGLVISPKLQNKLYYCSNCVHHFPQTFKFELYPLSWKEHSLKDDNEDIDYYGTVEWCYNKLSNINLIII
jgi:hypothetical protein